MPYGTSVLLTFVNASELERYLTEIYLQKNSVLYQVQFVNIAMSEEGSINILKTCMKSVKTLNKRERHKRQKTCVTQVSPVNSNFVEKINTFKRKILDGPYFTCKICNRCFYKRSAIDYKEEKYNIFVEGLYTDVTSFDGNHVI